MFGMGSPSSPSHDDSEREDVIPGYSSSNVRQGRFKPSKNELDIAFGKSGGVNENWYRYFGVKPHEAQNFKDAMSKGTWVWDALRIRGTQYGHQKPYQSLTTSKVGSGFGRHFASGTPYLTKEQEIHYANLAKGGDMSAAWQLAMSLERMLGKKALNIARATNTEVPDLVQEGILSVVKRLPGSSFDPEKGKLSTYFLKEAVQAMREHAYGGLIHVPSHVEGSREKAKEIRMGMRAKSLQSLVTGEEDEGKGFDPADRGARLAQEEAFMAEMGEGFENLPRLQQLILRQLSKGRSQEYIGQKLSLAGKGYTKARIGQIAKEARETLAGIAHHAEGTDNVTLYRGMKSPFVSFNPKLQERENQLQQLAEQYMEAHGTTGMSEQPWFDEMRRLGYAQRTQWFSDDPEAAKGYGKHRYKLQIPRSMLKLFNASGTAARGGTMGSGMGIDASTLHELLTSGSASISHFSKGGTTVQQRSGDGGDWEKTLAEEGARVIPVDIARKNKQLIDMIVGAGGSPDTHGDTQVFGKNATVPIYTTPGERIIPAKPAAENKPILDMMTGNEGKPEHYARGGVAGVSKLAAGYLGFQGGITGVIGSMMSTLAGNGAGSSGPSKLEIAADKLIEASDMLMDVAESFMEATGMSPTYGSGLWEKMTGNTLVHNADTNTWDEMSKHSLSGIPTVKQPAGDLMNKISGFFGGKGGFLEGIGLKSSGAVATTEAGAAGAGAGGQMAAMAGGPAGAAIMVAMALKAVLDKAVEAFHNMVDVVPGVVGGFTKLMGMPEEVVGAMKGLTGLLVTPIHMVGDAFHMMLSPIEALMDPFKMLKTGFAGLAEAFSSTVKLIWSLKDPVSLLSQSVDGFSKQVAKFDPGKVDRMNIAFDNLSAAAGSMFGPIIDAAAGFADELNVLYTSFAPEISSLMSEISGPIRDFARELAVGFAGVIREGIPIFRQLMQDSAPLGEIMRNFSSMMLSAISSGIGVFGNLREVIGGFSSWITTVSGNLVSVAAVFAEMGDAVIGAVMPIVEGVMTIGQAIFGFLDSLGVFRLAFDLAMLPIRLFTVALTTASAVIQDFGAQVSWAVQKILSMIPLSGVANPGARPEMRDPREVAAAAMRDVMNPGQEARADRGPLMGMLAGLRNFGNGARPQPVPLEGPRTFATQQTRNIGIEEIGMEARRAAFSQGGINPQVEIADNTREMRRVLHNIQQALQNLGINLPGLLNPPEAAM